MRTRAERSAQLGPPPPSRPHDSSSFEGGGRWGAAGMLETSVPGVFAVGDVRAGGTRMAAPAVGEGGMAVRFAAEHLARRSAPPST